MVFPVDDLSPTSGGAQFPSATVDHRITGSPPVGGDFARTDSRGCYPLVANSDHVIDGFATPYRAATTLSAATNRSASAGVLYNAGVTRTQSPFANPVRQYVKRLNSSSSVRATA